MKSMQDSRLFKMKNSNNGLCFFESSRCRCSTPANDHSPASDKMADVRCPRTMPVAFTSGVSKLGAVSLGTSTGKTVVMKSGSTTTTLATADQIVLTYTVTAGKTFYMQYFTVSVMLNSLLSTLTNFGNVSIENPAGVRLFTTLMAGPGVAPLLNRDFAEPVPLSSGTVVRIVCTPAAIGTYTWYANFGGFEI